MIKWNSTLEITPEAGREIIARNPDKDISYSSAVKQCRSMKFAPHFEEELIKSIMIDDELTRWVYVEGEE